MTRAPTSDEVRARHQANRAAWNEGAARYTQKRAETLAFLRAGGSNLHPIERANLGDLRAWCRVAIHLQCASGRDTLSLWNEGVPQVIGVDISDVHIANARWLTAELNAPATWYCCDLLDTPHELDGIADLVYTGRGALCWLHDLYGWAAVIARLLKPGGVLSVFDDHPITWLFEMDTEDLVPTRYDYFTHSEASQGWPATYIGDLGRAGGGAGAQVRAAVAPVGHFQRAARGRAGCGTVRRTSRRILGWLPQTQAGAKGAPPDDVFDDRTPAACRKVTHGRPSIQS